MNELLGESEDTPWWEDYKVWAHDLRLTVELEQNRRFPFGQPSIDSLAETSREMGDRFGTYLNFQCQSIKSKLMDLEYKGTGRVRLAEYYSGAATGLWNFHESVDYLRALGALDESNPSHPSVIISNLILSPSNCVNTSNYYSVCCLNECEGLMSTLEQAIGAPTAKPEQIAGVIAGLPSETMDSPGLLQALQMQRLEEIAAQHGGSVPLHGRLFAQWMHHMYPRECPYPHLADTTNPISPDEWIKKVGNNEASDEEMQRYSMKQVNFEESAPTLASAAIEELPWLAVEELVVSPERIPQPRHFGRLGALPVAGLLALVAASALRSTRASGGAAKGIMQPMARAESYFV